MLGKCLKYKKSSIFLNICSCINAYNILYGVDKCLGNCQANTYA